MPSPSSSSGPTTALVLGILSVTLGLAFPPAMLLGIPAWIMGRRALRQIRNGAEPQSGAGLAQAGWILGCISTILASIGLVVLLTVAILGRLYVVPVIQDLTSGANEKVAPAPKHSTALPAHPPKKH